MVSRGKKASGRTEPMKRTELILLLITLVPFVYSQEDQPGSVKLEIPPVIVEIDNEDHQELSINIPEINDITLPGFGLDLPDPADISVKELPLETLPLPVFSGAESEKEASFFSEGTLGIGSSNQLEGFLRLFKLGKGLKYSILFSHFGIDGYGTRDAGKGFFNREEMFQGSVSNQEESFSYSGEGSLTERENGLQEQSSSYSSVVHRFREASLTVNGKGKNWGWDVNASVKEAERVLSGSTPLSESTLLINPGAKVTYENGPVDLFLSGEYRMEYRKEEDLFFQNLLSTLGLGYHFPFLDINAGVSAEYVFNSGFKYPFSLSLSGFAGDFFRFRGSGGLKIIYYDNYSLWDEYPFASEWSGSGDDWFVTLDIRSDLSAFLSVFASGQWDQIYSYSGFTEDQLPDPVTGLFSVPVAGTYRSLSLSGGADLAVSKSGILSVQWKGQFLSDTDPFSPLQLIEAEYRFTGRNPGLSGAVDTSWPVYPMSSIPEIGGNLTYNTGGGVSLVLEMKDVLSLVSGGDRKLFGPYIDSSGEISLKIKISL